MHKVNMKIWGKSHHLNVIYDRYAGEEVLPIQEDALSRITNNTDAIDKALPKVKDYCLKSEYKGNLTANDSIFKYVKPKSLYVKRTKKDRIVALLCDYKFDLEHGLAIVFKNEKLKEIGEGDIIG